MKKFKVVFKVGFDDLEIEADNFADCMPDFFEFFKNWESKETEMVCMVSKDSVLYIKELPK